MLLQTLGHEIEMQDVAKALSADGPGFTRYYLLFMALVLAPVAEEIVFRVQDTGKTHETRQDEGKERSGHSHRAIKDKCSGKKFTAE